ncbi:MAG: hypothetical protein JXA57_03130 [Armatimonadetes bacterium]|nr:hypothetical protein [Armatimonadota bacterium]
MSRCLPNLCKCELPDLLPFIEFINSSENRQYQLERCLDTRSGCGAQPEALFREPNTDPPSDLVLEHKSIEWPPGAIERHRIEHEFTDQISDALSEIRDLAPWEFKLWPIPKSSKRTRAHWVSALRRAVSKHRDLLLDGGELSQRQPYAFTLHQLSPGHPDYEAGENGIMFVFSAAPRRQGDFTIFDHEVPPDVLRRQIESFLLSTCSKFADYEGYRRVLLLEGFYELGYYVAGDDVLSASRGLLLPPHLDEVWYCDWQQFDCDDNDYPEYTRVL